MESKFSRGLVRIEESLKSREHMQSKGCNWRPPAHVSCPPQDVFTRTVNSHACLSLDSMGPGCRTGHFKVLFRGHSVTSHTCDMPMRGTARYINMRIYSLSELVQLHCPAGRAGAIVPCLLVDVSSVRTLKECENNECLTTIRSGFHPVCLFHFL
jgi:hypothetical protein